MQPNLHDETDEGLTAASFDAEERGDEADFGNWPEIVGIVAVALITFLILQVTG